MINVEIVFWRLKKASQSYHYDATNRLVEGTNWKGDISTYNYNGLGQRMQNSSDCREEKETMQKRRFPWPKMFCERKKVIWSFKPFHKKVRTARLDAQAVRIFCSLVGLPFLITGIIVHDVLVIVLGGIFSLIGLYAFLSDMEDRRLERQKQEARELKQKLWRESRKARTYKKHKKRPQKHKKRK